MKQINANLKKGEIRVMPQSLHDLWYLSTIIDAGDLIRGWTIRKIKMGEGDQRKAEVIKKPVLLSITAEKIEFDKSVLRVSGKTAEANEEVQKGVYHTFTIEENSDITIIKNEWLKFQLDRLKDAMSEKSGSILICVHDREEAYFAALKKYGYEILSSIKGNVQKKAEPGNIESNFYSEIISQISEYDKRLDFNRIIIASPAFWKEDLMKVMKEERLKKKVILAACSDIGKNGIDEVIKRPEVNEALRQERIAKESLLVEEFLSEISKGGFSAYGLSDLEEAVNSGAIKFLLITDSAIQKSREEASYGRIDGLMKATEKTKGDIVIISSENDAGRKLNGLGGIGAILRFKLRY